MVWGLGYKMDKGGDLSEKAAEQHAPSGQRRGFCFWLWRMERPFRPPVRGAYPLLGAESQETGAFIQMLEEREEQVLELLSCQIQLKDDTLDYVERQTYQGACAIWKGAAESGQTSFRYQILSADGARPAGQPAGGRPDLEELVSQVYLSARQHLRRGPDGAGV